MLLKDRILDSGTCELVTAGNTKQALKNVDKKLKKSPKNVGLLTTKAGILFEARDYAECRQLCIQLSIQSPPITDASSLYILAYTLLRLPVPAQKDAETLWQNALKVLSGKKAQDLAEDWADFSIQNSQWEFLGKAVALLSRFVPKSEPEYRSYWYWGVVANLLASKDPNVDTRMQSIYAEIALRTLENAAEATPKSLDNNQASGKWIAKTSELEMILCFRASNEKLCKSRNEFVLKIFANPVFAPRTKIGANQWYLSKAHYAAMIREDRWEDLYSVAKETLQYAQDNKIKWLCDDFETWRSLLGAALQLKLNIEEVLAFAQSFDGPRDSSRSAHRVSMQLMKRIEGGKSTRDVAKMVEPVSTYFDAYSDTPRGDMDLRPDVEAMVFDEFSEFRHNITKSTKTLALSMANEVDQLKWLTAEISTLALEWTYMMAPSRHIRLFDLEDGLAKPREILTEFVTNCLRLYGVSRCMTRKMAETDTYPGDDAISLAVEAMSQLARTDRTSQIRMMLLSDYLLADSKHNAHARQRMMWISQRSGLASVSNTWFERHNVKGVLHETQSGRYLAGSGTSCPHTVRNKGGAYEVMGEALEFFQDAEARLPRFVEIALTAQNYVQALQFQDLNNRLRLSPTRRMLHFERRRMARLGNIPYKFFDPDIDSVRPWGSAPLPPCPEEVIAKIGPKGEDTEISVEYLQWLEVVDRIYGLAMSPVPPPFEMPLEYKDLVFGILKNIETHMLSTPQKQAVTCLHALLEVVQIIHYPGQSGTKDDITDVLVALEYVKANAMWLQETTFMDVADPSEVKNQPFPEQDNYQSVFLGFEFGKVLLALSDNVTAWLKTQATKSRIADVSKCQAILKVLSTIVTDHVTRNTASALRWRRILYDTRDGTDMVEWICGGGDAIGSAIIDLMGEQRIKRCLGIYVESSLQGMEGVVAIGKLVKSTG